jgi:HAD superfamily hydrolase (TIGR01509 family)
MVTSILFDVYETLVTERYTASVRASSLGESLGLDGAAFRKSWKPRRSRVIRGHVSFADALVEIGAELGHLIDPDAVSRVVDARRRDKSAILERFDPEALGVIRRLHALGIRLAVVSNAFPEDVHAWTRCAAAQWFHAAVFSFDVGGAKPERTIYLEAINRLGAHPAETLFVGDGGDDELLGAERAGLRAAQAGWFRGELAGLPASIQHLKAWPAVLDLVIAG